MEKVQWKVEGMDCTTCALNIHKYLEKKGMKNVKVNFATGDVSFDTNGEVPEEKLATGVNDLGYAVASHPTATITRKPFLTTHLQRFWFCFPFTTVLVLHMLPGVEWHWLMNPWLQLGLTIPVYLVGMSFLERVPGKVCATGCPI